ncbi:MAG: peptidoglycan DD-metalloendopeptidase family protein [Ruminococcus sp.]|nr:peptidoglycan DD-metalloendopeptidase family protein [Ruminococcus sp.]
MKLPYIAKKIVSVACCAALSAAIVCYYPDVTNNKSTVHARTLQEIQEEREQRQQEINALQAQLDSLGADKANTQAYQNTLMQQAELIRQNIASVNLEIDSIQADIDATEANITRLENDIAAKQEAINKKVEEFKERLYSMYVSGDNSLAAVILGSSSFYDTIVNIEMVNRIAEYDEDLINDILDDISSMEDSKKQLESEKLTLEMKRDSLETKKKEKEAELADYNQKMAQTQEVINNLALQEQMVNGDKAALEGDLSALDNEAEQVKAAIERERQLAQQRYEEEQRRKAQEEAERQAALNPSSGGGTSYVTPSYVVPNPSSVGFTWPAPGYCYISSPYGWRWGRLHAGIDVGDAGIGGGMAVAARSGTVVSVYNSCHDDYPKSSSCGCNGGYGNCVVISHDGTYSTLYGHLRYATVSVGQYVEAGQQIGAIGCTGFSTGDHLHFEVWVNGSRQNPLSFVSP